MYPTCPICYAICVDDPVTFIDTLAVHLEKAHHARLVDGEVELLPGIPLGLDIALRRRRYATVAILLLGGTAAISVTWATPMPDAAYKVEVTPAPALLGKVTSAITAKTAAGLTLTLTSTVAGVLASEIEVTAYELIQGA